MGVVYCPIIAQQYCTRMCNAGWRGGWKDGWFVHNSLDVDEYLVKANLPSLPHRRTIDSSRTEPHGAMAFTRYCHHQYCMASIAIQDGQGGIRYCAKVWAMEGGVGDYSNWFLYKGLEQNEYLVKAKWRLPWERKSLAVQGRGFTRFGRIDLTSQTS